MRPPFDASIAAANEQRARGMLTVAADVPSGLSAQTGKAAAPCVKANETVTMIVSKPGLETPFAFAFCGTVSVAPLAYIDPILDEKKESALAKPRAASTNDRTLDENDEKAAASSKRTAHAEAKRPTGRNNEFLRAEAKRRRRLRPLFRPTPRARAAFPTRYRGASDTPRAKRESRSTSPGK